jgi:hypothetical protein
MPYGQLEPRDLKKTHPSLLSTDEIEKEECCEPIDVLEQEYADMELEPTTDLRAKALGEINNI